jgi:hypothetical protein
MPVKKQSDRARDATAGKSQTAQQRDELDAKDLDKVTGGMASKIVKSADPCEGGR